MIFIDTGAFISYFLAADQYHEKSCMLWQGIQKKRIRCFTSNFVLDETLTLLGRKANYSFAAECAHVIYSSEVFSIMRPQFEEELAAIKLFEKYADQKVSFTDCISFILMKKHKLTKVFTFDKHFLIAGFDYFAN